MYSANGGFLDYYHRKFIRVTATFMQKNKGDPGKVIWYLLHISSTVFLSLLLTISLYVYQYHMPLWYALIYVTYARQNSFRNDIKLIGNKSQCHKMIILAFHKCYSHYLKPVKYDMTYIFNFPSLMATIHSYCFLDYYGPRCDTLCLPPSAGQHFTCDGETGAKRCESGQY